MPTSPTEPHQVRQVAEGFGADAGRYDRARPDYPDDMVRRIVAASPGPAVLDVGCGTGIAARQFQAAGCQVLGVDVDARMAEQARRRGLDVEVCAIETWDPAGRLFDAVVAGQTWHWVEPVGGAAKAAEVLRPGGRLALFWNVFQPPPDVAEAFGAVYRQLLPVLPAAAVQTDILATYQVMFDTAARGIRQAGGFDEPVEWRFDWDRTYSREEWLDQVPTHGGANRLPPGKLDELIAGIGAAIDAVGGSFAMHYTTVVVTAVRR
jgi:SAM-dependent methyltransferase